MTDSQMDAVTAGATGGNSANAGYGLNTATDAGASPKGTPPLTPDKDGALYMNRASDGVSPLPVTVPPKRNPKKPRPPVGASSLGTSPAPTDVVIF
jgi:hypothetical protein